MIPHTASNSVLSPLPTIHFDGLFLLTLDLPPGLRAIIGQTSHTPPPPSKVPRHHILVLLPASQLKSHPRANKHNQMPSTTQS